MGKKQAKGNNDISYTWGYEWFARFKTGHKSTEGDPRSGRLITSTDNTHIQKIIHLVHKTVVWLKELAEEFEILIESKNLTCIKLLQSFSPVWWLNSRSFLNKPTVMGARFTDKILRQKFNHYSGLAEDLNIKKNTTVSI